MHCSYVKKQKQKMLKSAGKRNMAADPNATLMCHQVTTYGPATCPALGLSGQLSWRQLLSGQSRGWSGAPSWSVSTPQSSPLPWAYTAIYVP